MVQKCIVLYETINNCECYKFTKNEIITRAQLYLMLCNCN